MNGRADGIDLAQHYVLVGQPRRALEALANAGGGDLEDPWFWRLRATAHYDLEEGQRAVEAAREGLKHDPHDIGLLRVLGMAEAEEGRLAEAEQAALAALELASDDPDLLCDYARVVARGGQLDKANRLVDRAESLDPEGAEVIRMRAFLAYLRGQDRKAAALAEKVLEDDPEDPGAHRLRGAALLQRGDLRGAGRSLETVVRGDPTDHALADTARSARAGLHPLLWPMLPMQRLGVAGSWIAAMAIIFGLRGLGQETAASIAGAVWLILVIYSWVVAPAIEKRLSS